METVRPTPDLDYLGLGSGPEVRSNLDASTLPVDGHDPEGGHLERTWGPRD